MTVADKILFKCASCDYKARIPAHYAGRSIHCPGCKTIQAVAAIEVATAGGDEPSLNTPALGNPILPAPGQGKIVFTCPECSYKGRLSSEYDGKTIRCPGCQKPQLVNGEPVQSPIVASMAADESAFRPGESAKIRFECGACGYRAKIPGKYAGRTIHCPQCKEVQVVDPETDLEEATGRTVTITKVAAAEVHEARLAMTNVGVQFACAICGYESRISPSCAGDAVYCPSCRAPQKVEWGDQEEADEAPAAAVPARRSEPAPPVAPPSAPSVSLDLPSGLSAGSLAQGAVNKDDVTDISKMLTDPEAPAPAFVPEKVQEHRDGGRRVIGGHSPAAELAKPSLAPPAKASAKATVASVPAVEESPEAVKPAGAQRRRSVKQAGPSAESESIADTSSGQPASLRPAPVAKTSKMPLMILTVVAVLLLAGVVWLLMQTGGLKDQIAQVTGDLEKQRTATTTAKQDAEAAQALASTTQASLEATKGELVEAQASLVTAKEGLAATSKELAEKQAALAQVEASLIEERTKLAEAQKALDDLKNLQATKPPVVPPPAP